MKATKIDPYWHINIYENESYKDVKIPRNEVIFPSHVGEQLNGKVTTYRIEELESNQK